MNKSIVILIVYIILILVTPKKYIWYLPTIPIYKNNEEEILEVERMVLNRSHNDVRFFKETDRSVSYAFSNIVPESIEQLDTMITRTYVTSIIYFFKYTINRARPKQYNNSLDILHSNSADTPSYPAGHAFQAYYLAKVLGKKYPYIKHQLDNIARECDLTRVKAGIHYPSDGDFSKKLVDTFF
tara:strand:- start:1456 stop:2007 length:552 start_codon:yes stop_codon:yes gene_type:complete